jgi:hypothetical protein
MGVSRIKPSGNVVAYQTGSVNAVYTYSGNGDGWASLTIINDGVAALTFTVNGMTITVNANESFTDDFVDFTTITVTTSVAYRLLLRE